MATSRLIQHTYNTHSYSVHLQHRFITTACPSHWESECDSGISMAFVTRGHGMMTVESHPHLQHPNAVHWRCFIDVHAHALGQHGRILIRCWAA